MGDVSHDVYLPIPLSQLSHFLKPLPWNCTLWTAPLLQEANTILSQGWMKLSRSRNFEIKVSIALKLQDPDLRQIII